VTPFVIFSPALFILLLVLILPLLVRGEVGAIPIAPGEVQRWHTRDAYSCTQAIVVCAAWNLSL